MRDKFHVLIVKDEPRIAVSWQEALEHAGYYVTCVGRGRTALQRLESERIDVAVVDPSLSDMAGEVLVHMARERWPQLRMMLLGADLTTHPELVEDPDVLMMSRAATPKILKKHLSQLLQEPIAPLWTVRGTPGARSSLQ